MKDIFTASAAALSAIGLGSQSKSFSQFVVYTPPQNDDHAVERIDPIVNFDSHSAHVHQLYGSCGLEKNMTYDSLQQSACTNVGDAKGRQVLQDHSVYWHPALYMEALDDSSYIRIKVKSHKMYYRRVGHDDDVLADPFEFPEGYRALAGHPTKRAPSDDGIVEWHCYANGTDIVGKGGKFPENIIDCPDFPGLNAHIHYPHCWNGKDFDPAAPESHYSYPIGDPMNGRCPESHPKRIPHIFAEHEFDLHGIVDKVKPNTFVLSNGDSTGCGFHGDFFNGWARGALPHLFDTCPQGQWGNHDIGTCPDFKAGPPTTECKQTQTFFEEVDAPGQYLPGCNPIITTNPAPKFEVAPIGACQAECPKAGTAHAFDHPAPPDNSSKSKPASYPHPTTTLATSIKPPGTPGPVIDYVTEVVTVPSQPTPPSYHKRHAHMDAHRNHARPW